MWQSNMIDYEQLDDGPVAKGTRYRGTTRVAGKAVGWEAEVVERSDDGTKMVLRTTGGPLDWELTYTYEQEDGGTRFTFHHEVASLGGFFGRLTDPLVTKLYGRDVHSNLEKLGELVESGETA
jgi:hypothetical protein